MLDASLDRPVLAGVRPEHRARLAELARQYPGRAFAPAELAPHLGVSTDWARRLLRTLYAAGLVEVAEPAGTGGPGRPTPRYRLSLSAFPDGEPAPRTPAPVGASGLATSAIPVGPDDDRRLQVLLLGWLETTYANPGTRLTYGHALGLEAAAERPNPIGTRPGPYRQLAWLRWCHDTGRDPLQVVTADVTRWQIELTRAGMAPATRDKWLKAAKGFCGFLADRGLLPANPAALTRDQRRKLGLTGLAGKTRTPLVLTPAQVYALLAAAGRTRPGRDSLVTLRARATVALFTLGMRVSELTGLTRDALHTTHGRRALRYTTKGGKPHTVYLTTLAADALADYLTARDHADGGALPALPGEVRAGRSPLLATRHGGCVDRRDVWALLRRLAAAGGPDLAGLADVLHPHALRHFYVTTGLDAGAPIDVVSADVGHASTEVTQRSYDHSTRTPGRSAADLVATTITTAGAPDPSELDRFTAALARLTHPDPLEQLDAAHTLRRHATHPALTDELAIVLAGRLQATDLHPRVHQALRDLQENL